MAEEFMVDDYLELIDELVYSSKSLPFGSKKAMVDTEQIHEYIDKIRLNMPEEMRQAKKLVNQRKTIIDEANKSAEDIITRAEARARDLVANHEIVKAAEAKAAEIEKQAIIRAKSVKTATDDYIVDMLAKAETTLSESLNAVRRTKSSIKSSNGQNN